MTAEELPGADGRRWLPSALRAAVADLSPTHPATITLDVAAPADELTDALACGIAWCRLVGGDDGVSVIAHEQTANAALALLASDRQIVTVSATPLAAGLGVMRVTALAPIRTEIEIDLDAGVATVTLTDENGTRVLPPVWEEPSVVSGLLPGDRRLAQTLLASPSYS